VTFRSKLLVNFLLALLLSVGLVTAGVTVVTRHAFEELDREHTDALVLQFQKEFERRGIDVLNRVQGIADAEPTVRMAIDLSPTSSTLWGRTVRSFPPRNGRRGLVTKWNG
jgi:hypothetical protein